MDNPKKLLKCLGLPKEIEMQTEAAKRLMAEARKADVKIKELKKELAQAENYYKQIMPRIKPSLTRQKQLQGLEKNLVDLLSSPQKTKSKLGNNKDGVIASLSKLLFAYDKNKLYEDFHTRPGDMHGCFRKISESDLIGE